MTRLAQLGLLPGSLDAGQVTGLSFSADGQILAAGRLYGAVELWDVSTGQLVDTLDSGDHVDGVAFRRDGHLLAVGSGSRIQFWNPHNGQLLREVLAHPGANRGIRSIAFSPDGRLLASGANDGAIRLWDVDTGQSFYTLDTDLVLSVALSPDGRLLASGGEMLQLWDVQSGQLVQTLEGYHDLVHAVAFNPDGQTLASAGRDGIVWLWDVNTGGVVRKLEGHVEWVNSIAFNPDGDLLASGANDGRVRVSKVNGHRLSDTFEFFLTRPVTSVAFSPDGRVLASSGGYEGTISLWGIVEGD